MFSLYRTFAFHAGNGKCGVERTGIADMLGIKYHFDDLGDQITELAGA
ncbi:MULTISPECIES: hypothetical protein [Paraburkholderia]